MYKHIMAELVASPEAMEEKHQRSLQLLYQMLLIILLGSTVHNSEVRMKTMGCVSYTGSIVCCEVFFSLGKVVTYYWHWREIVNVLKQILWIHLKKVIIDLLFLYSIVFHFWGSFFLIWRTLLQTFFFGNCKIYQSDAKNIISYLAFSILWTFTIYSKYVINI
jgi:hypothetical protein